MIDIPLYQLEHARRKLDRLIEGDGIHRVFDASDQIDHDTLRDVMDHYIEIKRRENDAHRMTVATGGNREARL